MLGSVGQVQSAAEGLAELHIEALDHRRPEFLPLRDRPRVQGTVALLARHSHQPGDVAGLRIFGKPSRRRAVGGVPVREDHILQMLVNLHGVLGPEQVPRNPLPRLARRHPLIQRSDRSDEGLRLVWAKPASNQLSSVQHKRGHCSNWLCSVRWSSHFAGGGAGVSRGCSWKKRTISREARGPVGSVYEPLELPPDQLWPAPWMIHRSTTTCLRASW